MTPKLNSASLTSLIEGGLVMSFSIFLPFATPLGDCISSIAGFSARFSPISILSKGLPSYFFGLISSLLSFLGLSYCFSGVAVAAGTFS